MDKFAAILGVAVISSKSLSFVPHIDRVRFVFKSRLIFAYSGSPVSLTPCCINNSCWMKYEKWVFSDGGMNHFTHIDATKKHTTTY